ncbi:MAG TPA: SDR family oxidoreductase [Saprospiraceae bacterium]|nr:SDR family oxidoreductase [Saprospiraceae bacterium]
MKFKILVTGGAGFIGSNLVKTLLSLDQVKMVRVLDNLSTGHFKNLEELKDNSKFEFLEGDIRDFKTCKKACEGIDLISHQAALGSVPRSIIDPLTTNSVNITGTLNVFQAAIEQGVKRVVFAASSSTYGDSKELPKIEDKIGKPLSPYAVTKYVNELYAEVFALTYGIEYVGLRYFNIFGPNQDPNGAYAAVIPLFFKAALTNNPPIINGDGSNSRDFTYVENAVTANLKALFTENNAAINSIYNIACEEQTSLLELWNHIKKITGTTTECIFGPNRIGDIPHSLASIEKAKTLLAYNGDIKIKEGLELAYSWYKKNN